MATFLQQVDAARSTTGLSGRRLCARLPFSRATYGRWRGRQRCGQPLLHRPGPARTGPLPLAQVREEIRHLAHAAKRTRGTGRLYQQYRHQLSRRQFGVLVEEERQRQQNEQRSHLQHLAWQAVQTAWALDATEWPTCLPGVKLQVLAARDLASNYCLGLWAAQQLSGHGVAEYLAQLLRCHGRPLFLKRDNGAVLHTPEVEQVLAEAAVLPLDSPANYPQYNGGMEKHIGDLKRLFPYPLPEACARELNTAQALLASLRHEFNARPRPGLDDCSPAEMFYSGPHLHVDRSTRAAIFESLCEAARAILISMRTSDQRSIATAWRLAAQSWLRSQALISVAQPQPPTNNNPQNQQLLPLYFEKWPH